MRRSLRLLALLTASVALLVAPSIARAEPAVALDGTSLTFFDTATPGTFVTRAIAGLPNTASFPVVAMDVRPVDGQLYVITVNNPGVPAMDGVGQLWKIDLELSVATQVGSPFAANLADTGFWGMDFNPAADRIRLVEGGFNDQYRIFPSNGALQAQDADLTQSNIGDVAYDRNVLDATATTAFAVNYNGGPDKLVRIGGVDGAPSPNGGVVTDIGPLGVDITNAANFDISPVTGIGYINEGANLYTVNLTTGTMTSIATLTFPATNGVALLGTSTFDAAPTAVTATEAAGTATVTVTRTGVTNKPATVAFATANGTATAGTDYVAVSGTLSFAAGDTSKSIQVPIVQDTAVDAAETLTVTLSGATDYASIGAATATVTIGDDDVADTTRPLVFLPVLPARSYGSLARLGVTARYSVSEASTSRMTLKLGTRVVGSAVARVTAGPAITASRAALTLRGKNLVRAALAASRTGRIALVLTLTTRDAAGNTRTTLQRVVVTR